MEIGGPSLSMDKWLPGDYMKKGIKKKIPIRWEVRQHYSKVAFNCGIPTALKLRKVSRIQTFQ